MAQWNIGLVRKDAEIFQWLLHQSVPLTTFYVKMNHQHPDILAESMDVELAIGKNYDNTQCIQYTIELMKITTTNVTMQRIVLKDTPPLGSLDTIITAPPIQPQPKISADSAYTALLDQTYNQLQRKKLIEDNAFIDIMRSAFPY